MKYITKKKEEIMDKIISLCKRRGFVYPASEIYGGFANAYDFGPLGSQLKKNIKDYWWKKFVIGEDNIVGLDSAIIQNPKTWEASGHLNSFTDPLVECKKCHQRFRVDHVQEVKTKMAEGGVAANAVMGSLDKLGMTKEMTSMVLCTAGGEHDFSEAREFNLMFKTFVGVTDDSSSVAYMRPETAQGIFLNFKNVIQSTRVKPPFGIAQIGKSFRNEITPGNFIFRTREFEQMEIEFFIEPNPEESKKWYEYWIEKAKEFYLELGIKSENLSIRAHDEKELSFYSIGTSDVEYKFPFGVSELGGIAQRTDYDLSQHEKVSGLDLKFFDETMGSKYLPYVVEPALGVDRAALAILTDAFDESDGSDGRAEGEITLRLNPKVAPIKVAVFPLIKKEGLPEIAREIVAKLKKSGITTYYDESGSVGRRYRRQDEIGTPWCITVDFDTLADKTATLRDRDSMTQERINIDEIVSQIEGKLR
ncbi:MAG: glycine--tRNA ligase [Candidatus Berkelbacteria bacterium]|nr:glycine--tRNA ligase [Candidatus Berkelbacteria bacterium]